MTATIWKPRSNLLRVLAGLVLLQMASVATVARAEMPTVTDEAAGAAAVVLLQLAAIDRGDALGAWAPASAGLRARFGTPAGYLEGLREGYGPLVNSHQRQLGEQVRLPSGEVGQWLDVIGPDGRHARALYLLDRIDGRWQTTGCLLFD